MGAPTTSRAPMGMTGRVADARGRVVSLLDPMPLWVLGRDEPIDRATLDAIVEDLGVPPRAGRRMLWFGLAVTGIALVIVAFTLTVEVARGGRAAVHDLVSSLVIMAPIGASAIVGGCIVPILAERKKRFEKLERLMLAHGRCPHCGFGIGGVPPAEDGAVVCPECASAWASPAGGGAAVAEACRPSRARTLVVLSIVGVLALLAGVAALLL